MLADASPGDPRLIPARLRIPAAVLAGCCAVVLLVLAVRYHGDRIPGRLDGRLFGVLPHAGTARPAVDQVATFAPLVAFGVATVATVAMLAARRWRAAVFAALGPGLTLLVVEVGKVVVDRTIDGGRALPSGHTAGVTSVALMVAVLLAGRARRPVRAAVLGLLTASVLGIAMGLVMVAMHSHYPTDVVAGYCAAVATTLGGAFAVDRIAARWDARRSRTLTTV